MALISLDEAKDYLRVDSCEEDDLICALLSSAGQLCADVARLTDGQWAMVDAGPEPVEALKEDTDENTDTEDENTDTEDEDTDNEDDGVEPLCIFHQSEDGDDDDDKPVYTEQELARVRDAMRPAVLYALAYLYEHREEADHHGLAMTLRAILFSLREGVC